MYNITLIDKTVNDTYSASGRVCIPAWESKPDAVKWWHHPMYVYVCQPNHSYADLTSCFICTAILYVSLRLLVCYTAQSLVRTVSPREYRTVLFIRLWPHRFHCISVQLFINCALNNCVSVQKLNYLVLENNIFMK